MGDFKIFKTSEFEEWLESQNPKIVVIVTARLDLMSRGHLGNHKRFDGLIELRWINGIRVYSFSWGKEIFIALIGGNKNGQDRDIKKAKKIRNEIFEGTRGIHK